MRSVGFMLRFLVYARNGRWARRAAGCIAIAMAPQMFWACDSAPTQPVTDPDSEIAILSPKAGERYGVGETVHVKWKTQGKGVDEVNAVNIEVSPDSGKSWAGLLDRSIGVTDPRWGDFPWTVPAQIQILGAAYPIAGNNRMRIRVMQYSTSDPNKRTVTPYTFAIAKD